MLLFREVDVLLETMSESNNTFPHRCIASSLSMLHIACDSFLEGIHCGVQHESCLGLLLFIFFINDHPFCLESCQVNLCADDTSI